jgi:hypothetical protein
VEAVVTILILALVGFLLVRGFRNSKRELARLNDVLQSLAGQGVTIVVTGMGGKIQWLVTVNGVVASVEGNRLYLDSPSVADFVQAQSLLLGGVRLEEGVQLESIRSVRGPRGTTHWP